MTGRDLIIYILENHLENEPFFKDGELLGFMNEEKAAAKFGVGTATIKVWVNEGLLEGIRIGDMIYIPQNATNPMLRNSKERISNDTDSSKSDTVRAIANAIESAIRDTTSSPALYDSYTGRRLRR